MATRASVTGVVSKRPLPTKKDITRVASQASPNSKRQSSDGLPSPKAADADRPQVALQRLEEDYRDTGERPGGIHLLWTLLRLDRAVLKASATFLSNFTHVSEVRRKTYEPGLLESVLYDPSKHDAGNSDILNVKELFGQAHVISNAAYGSRRCMRIWRFHLDWQAKAVDVVMLMSIMGTCFSAPLSFIWGGTWYTPEWVPLGGRQLLAFDLSMDIIYGICLLLQFRISYLHPVLKKEITDPTEIRHYLVRNLMFWLQCFSAFLYAWFFTGATLLGNNLKFVRVGPLFAVPNSLWRLEDYRAFRVSRPMLLLLIGSHWVACILYTLGGFREEYENRASDYRMTYNIIGYEGEVPGSISLYFMAFVEALYMLTGALDNPLGDGGPRDKDFGSLLIVLIFGPVGCVVVALFISSIVREQSLAYALETRHEENKAFMERALQILDIPSALQQRVLSMHLFQKIGHDHEAFSALFDQKNLSKSLENALLVYLYRDTVCISKYFQDKDPNYIIAVINVLEDHVFLPGDYVARKGEVAKVMYFVSRGILRILVPDMIDPNDVTKAKEVGTLTTGAHLGEIALVKETVRTAWVRADTYSIVSALSADSIADIWKFYPEEREELLRMVEATARRDRQRRAKQRWQKGLEGATALRHKAEKPVVKFRSRESDKSDRSAKRSSKTSLLSTSSESDHEPGLSHASSKQASMNSARGKTKKIAEADVPTASEVLSRGAFTRSDIEPTGLDMVLQRIEMVDSRFDDLMQRQTSLEQTVSTALNTMRATGRAYASLRSISASADWPGSNEEKDRSPETKFVQKQPKRLAENDPRAASAHETARRRKVLQKKKTKRLDTGSTVTERTLGEPEDADEPLAPWQQQARGQAERQPQASSSQLASGSSRLSALGEGAKLPPDNE